MSKISLELTGDWKKLADTLDPKRFNDDLERNLRAATQLNGMLAAKAIRDGIKHRQYAANSPLTILIKKSSMPLVDDADLFGAITWKEIGPMEVFVGILRTAMDKEGHPLVNLALMLHQGAQIPVTEHMRNMFAMLAEVGEGKRDMSTLEGRALEIAQQLGPRIKGFKALRATTTILTIPARPFIKIPLEDPRLLGKVRKNWERAIIASLRGQTAQTGAQEAAQQNKEQKQESKGGGDKPKKSPADRSEAARRGWKTRRAREAAEKGKK